MTNHKCNDCGAIIELGREVRFFELGVSSWFIKERGIIPMMRYLKDPYFVLAILFFVSLALGIYLL